MVTFKQFLNEKYSEPLFHGTGLFQLMSIVNYNELTVGFIDPIVSTPHGLNKGIPFTKSYDQAKNWARYKSNFPIVIQFNQQNIATKQRLKSISRPAPTSSAPVKKTVVDRFWSALKYKPIPELETGEYIATRNIRDVNKSIEKIFMDENTKNHIANEWPDFYSKIYGVLYVKGSL